MGKAIFLNFPTHGCINSLLGTVSELVNRGQKIIYYCTEEFRNKIEQTGAEFRPYKGVVNTFKIENDDLSKAIELSVEMAVDKLEHNLEAIRKEDPDYIVHDSLCTWGKQMAVILGCPSVNLMHSFPVTKSSFTFSKQTALLLAKAGFYKIKNKLKTNTKLATRRIPPYIWASVEWHLDKALLGKWRSFGQPSGVRVWECVSMWETSQKRGTFPPLPYPHTHIPTYMARIRLHCPKPPLSKCHSGLVSCLTNRRTPSSFAKAYRA